MSVRNGQNPEEKSVVDQLRSIRDQIGMEIQDMDFEQLKVYVNARLGLHDRSVWEGEGEGK
jgi:hypothetical protein